MEFNFDLRRLLMLAALLAGFAIIGGFSRPELPPESLHQIQRVHKAWFYCIALFVVGSASATLIDHWTGTMEPANLRPVYIVFGLILMASGVLWGRALKQTVEPSSQTVVHHAQPWQIGRPTG